MAGNGSLENSPIYSKSSVGTPEQYIPSCMENTCTVHISPLVGTNDPMFVEDSSGIAVSGNGHDQVMPVVGSPNQRTPSCMPDATTPSICSSVADTPCFGRRKTNDPVFVPDTPGLRSLGECRGGNTPFLTSAVQLEKLISSINATSCCRAEGCNGELRLQSVSLEDMGGDGTAYFTCSGRCGSRDVTLPCSGTYTYKGKDTKQTVMSVSLQIAFLSSGANYAQYENVLGSLGMHPVSHRAFYNTIEMLYDPVKEMLDAQCELGKKKMKEEPPEKMGSWDRAVTVADGAWLTRGHHSQNFTFHVRDYMRNSVLYYHHLSQRGKDSINEELYQGTSKSSEGFAADLLFRKMKEEGMNVALHWQDADSSSSNALRRHFGSGKTMLCGGHFSRAHYKKLNKLKVQKQFSADEIKNLKEQYPGVEKAKCPCIKHRHGSCGCITDAFISNSRRRVFKAMVDAKTDPAALESRLKMLPHHVRDEHEWKEIGEDGKEKHISCNFHDMLVCSCGKCDPKKVRCKRKRYTTFHKLTCPYHTLAYEIECHYRSTQAKQVIHRELGKGATNQLESAHSTLIRFRKKNWNIKRLHYHVSTNLGLMESNMSFMINVRGIQYHWLPELYANLGLPDFHGARAFFKEKNRAREKRRKIRKTEDYKKEVAKAKQRHRVNEQQERHNWSKAQKIQHNYESNMDYTCEPQHDDECSQVDNPKKGNSTLVKPCQCGSTTHRRITHRTCPLNKKSNPHACRAESRDSNGSAEPEDLSDFDRFPSDDSPVPSSDEDYFGENAVCNCGKAHIRTCPLNPRNLGKVKEHEVHSSVSLPNGANEGNVQSILREDGNIPSNTCCKGSSPSHSPLKVDCGQIPHRKRSLALKLTNRSPLTRSPKRRAVSRRTKISPVSLLSRYSPRKRKAKKAACELSDVGKRTKSSTENGADVLPSEFSIVDDARSDRGDSPPHFTAESPDIHVVEDDARSDRGDSPPHLTAESPDVIITAFQAAPEDIPVNPPSKEWMSAAVDYIKFWSKSIMVKDDERDIILPDSSVFPHKIDWIVGDGHCLFRAISKSITGTQKNHQAVRKAVVKWMVCSDHPTALAKYIVSYDWLAEIERDKSKCPQAIQNYIDTSGMSIAAWGSDKEMVALATMLQTTIFVSNNASGKRVWNCFHPLFWNPKYCMEKSNYKLYLHHSDSRTHYNRVIPFKE